MPKVPAVAKFVNQSAISPARGAASAGNRVTIARSHRIPIGATRGWRKSVRHRDVVRAANFIRVAIPVVAKRIERTSAVAGHAPRQGIVATGANHHGAEHVLNSTTAQVTAVHISRNPRHVGHRKVNISTMCPLQSPSANFHPDFILAHRKLTTRTSSRSAVGSTLGLPHKSRRLLCQRLLQKLAIHPLVNASSQVFSDLGRGGLHVSARNLHRQKMPVRPSRARFWLEHQSSPVRTFDRSQQPGRGDDRTCHQVRCVHSVTQVGAVFSARDFLHRAVLLLDQKPGVFAKDVAFFKLDLNPLLSGAKVDPKGLRKLVYFGNPDFHRAQVHFF